MEEPGKALRFDLSSVSAAFETRMRSRSLFWLPLMLLAPCVLLFFVVMMLVFDGFPPPLIDVEWLVLLAGMVTFPGVFASIAYREDRRPQPSEVEATSAGLVFRWPGGRTEVWSPPSRLGSWVAFVPSRDGWQLPASRWALFTWGIPFIYDTRRGAGRKHALTPDSWEAILASLPPSIECVTRPSLGFGVVASVRRAHPPARSPQSSQSA